MTRFPFQGPIAPVRPLEGIEKELVDQMILAVKRPEVFVEQVVVGSKFMGVIAGKIGRAHV